uniref:isoleucine N-monooxygenase 2-like n=1 Tax=Erigeron canadensis TaxID=72917 RepID=UPI001CB9A31D|nr:isoleucine N-monooxygenase 2-like [Erigeron canadensis]
MAPTNILFIFFIFIFFAEFFYKRYTKKLPPGPTPLPFIGCIIEMLLNRPTFRWIHKLMGQLNTPIICIRLGPSTHVITVSSSKLACEILKENDSIFMSRPEVMSANLVSNGYRTAFLAPHGDQWRKMRRVVKQNLLSRPMHNWFQPKRDEEANHLLRYICNQIDKKQDNIGGLINFRVLTQHFVANLTRKMAFGTRFFGKGMPDGGPGKEETEHVDALYAIHNYLFGFSVNDYFPLFRGMIDFSGNDENIKTALQVVRKYHDPLIDERIQMWNNGERTEKNDLLDVLINHENPKLTTEEIKAEIIDLILGTVDNPSNATEWAMAEMLNEPILLRKAVEELDNVVGRNRLVEEQDLSQLNFIKACIKEAFRLHPFRAFNPPHLSMTDTTVAGYFIPKGSHVLVSRLGLGRNPDVWENPLRFDPDRHLRGELSKQVVLSDDDELRMISFGIGIRGCPAVELGSTITTMLFARILHGFSWSVGNNGLSVSLAENHDDLSLAKPLVAIAEKRLPEHLYPKN